MTASQSRFRGPSCSVALQCVAVCCSVVQCGVVWCSVLQCDMTHTTGVVGQVALTGKLVLIDEAAQLKGALVGDSTQVVQSLLCCAIAYTHTATYCNTLQHTATHCNSLQLTATHCNSLQLTATHCNSLQLTATHCNSLQLTATH